MSDNMENKPVAQPATQQQPTAQPVQQPAAQQPAAQPTPAPQPAVQQQSAPVAKPAVQQQPASAAQPAPAPQPTEEPKKESAPTTSTTGKAKADGKKKKKKRKTDWGGRLITSILSIILGFVLGVGSVYGTVAAIIYSIGTQPVDESVELIDTVTGLKLYDAIFGTLDEDGKQVGGIISRKYEELKLKDLVVDVADAIEGLAGEGTTISDIAEISPIVGKTVEDLVEDINTKFGTPFTYEELKEAPITGEADGKEALTDYIMHTFMETEAGNLINAFLKENDTIAPIIRAFCYGQENVDYEINEEGKIEMLGDKQPLTLNGIFAGDMLALLDNVTIDLLLTIDPENPLMCSLAYGEVYRYEKETQDDGSSKVVMKQMYYGWEKDENDVFTFYENNDLNKPITYFSCTEADRIATLTIDTGKKDAEEQPVYETYYVTLDDGLVWQNSACTQELPYEKVTIGTLRSNALSVVEAVSLSDVVQIEEGETNPLKSIIYAEDGSSHTIGDLMHNSTQIINHIKLADFLKTPLLNSLLYKTDENGDYLIDEKTGEKIPRPLEDFLADDENPDKLTNIINSIKIAEILDEAGGYQSTNPLHALLYTNELDADGNPIPDGEGGYKKKPVTLGALDGDFVNNIEIAGIVGIKPEDKHVLGSILFDQEGNPLKLGEIQTFDFFSLYIADLLQIDPPADEDAYLNNPINSILFKKEKDTEGNYVKVSINDIKEEGFISNLKVADILGITPEDDGALSAILYKDGEALSLGELSTLNFGEIKLADVLTIPENTSSVLLSIVFTDTPVWNVETQKYEGTSRTLDDLTGGMQGIIDGLELADVITLPENAHPVLLSIIFDGTPTWNATKGEYEGTSRKISDLTGGMQDIIDGLELADVITLPENANSVLLSIVFKDTPVWDATKGEYVGTSRKLSELTNGMQDIIDGLELAEILTLPENANSVLLSIVFTDTPVWDATKGKYVGNSRKLGDLTGGMQGIIDGLELAEVLTLTEGTSPALLSIVFDGKYKLENGKYVADEENGGRSRKLSELTGDMSTILNTLKLADVMKLPQDAHPALLSIIFEDTPTWNATKGEYEGTSITLGDLASGSAGIINKIKLKDVITSDAPLDPLLKSIIYKNGDENQPRTLLDFTDDDEGEGAQNIINNIKLADVLSITDTSHKALIFLAYGSDNTSGTPRTLGEIRTDAQSGALIDNIPLSYIITPNTNDKIISYLLYGKEGIHYTLSGQEPIMQKRYVALYDNHVYNEYGEDLGDHDGSMSYTENGVTYTLVDASKTVVTASGHVATAYYLIKDGTDVYFTETTLREFSGSSNSITKLTSRLTAGDILGDEINSNKMLKYLADTPIDKLGAKLNELTFEQVFADDIYEKSGDEFVTDVNGDRILKDVWHYMLTDKDTGKNGAGDYYVLTGMNTLLENMKYNVHLAKLRDLANDGILNLSEDILNRAIIVKIAGVDVGTSHPEGTLIGDLTTEEMLAYVEVLLATVDYVNGSLP